MVRTHPGAENHPFYGEWVQGYAADEYAAANRALVEQMEALSAGYTEGQLERLVEIFVDCSRFEGLFWDMAWDMEM